MRCRPVGRLLVIVMVAAAMLVVKGADAMAEEGKSGHAPLVNWAAPQAGARFHAGPHTEFLDDNDLSRLTADRGDRVIFRHGPRGLEKVIIVELARPVPVRSVVFGTSIDDVVRVPSGAQVFVSETGDPDSYRLVGACTSVRAPRTLIAVTATGPVRWVKLAFSDTGGGSRVSWIGVFSESPEVVKQHIGGLTPEDLTPFYARVGGEMARLREQYGPKGDLDLTFHCGAIEYASPPLPGPGTLLARYLAEDSHIKRQLEKIHRELPIYKTIGVTALETYVRWNLVEAREGQYDWSIYDAFLHEFRQQGMKWVPMILMGPAYTLPDWYWRAPEFTPLRCLEHGQDSAIASLWDPHIRPHIDAFFRAFAEHYHAADLQSVMLGISGNYGENLYPAGNPRDWTTTVTGDYHTHPGWWAGDRYAAESFRAALQHKYQTLEALNAAWQSSFQSFAELAPMLPERYRTRQARLDFTEWYLGSMTDYLEFWLQTARKYLPTAKLLISTGGSGWPGSGSDFPAVAKLAARYGAGVRITNEGPDYADTFARTRWISSACRCYGSWLGTEPWTGQIDNPSIAYRVFNAATSGAAEMFCYPSGLWNREGYAKLMESLPQLRHMQPTPALAYWVPRTHLLAEDDSLDYIGQMIALRKVSDFDAVDSLMIADGALSRYRVLLMGYGRVERATVLPVILRWVREGGVLVRLGDGKLTMVEGSTAYDRELFGDVEGQQVVTRTLGQGRVVWVPLGDSEASWLTACRAARAALPDPGPALPEGVFAVSVEGATALLNTQPNPVTIRLGERSVTVGAQAMAVVPR